MSRLFAPLSQRSLTLRNRLVVSPMCQYSAVDGVPNNWHLVHLGSRAVGGAGLVMTEACAVSPQARISPADTGLWNAAQAEAWHRISCFLRSREAAVGVQLSHAGRKASVEAPWLGGKGVTVDAGGWTPVAPSALAFREDSPQPRALEPIDIRNVIDDFAAAAQRALDACFQLVEIHAAHGYLLHQFLSPLSNQREDRYGGSFENRIRLLREVLVAVREVWPERLPLWLRISATDWADGGWDIEQSVELARIVKDLGVDLIDVSSGGLVPHARIPVEPGYQVPFSARIRREAGIATGAVGLITRAAQAEKIVVDEEADVVLLARELLRDPYFPLRAAQELGANVHVPEQYQRAW
ncbi:NADH:flavin oxidoreductase/NADH oxidase [Lysobacter capsici]|uniref:NADH:flavin oxidoreductase/NADH oxidase n=1 Tax=Lysobacter capsici TaxID=435897 RepID=UPI00287BBF70|nr:NADH:flavin oxidoreductase/NADH oxidase [Lysobacter capsici]WND82321.1 NADH:flavin oxidoreductase/NADH oxidase [Lysobacter capsici]WND87517.1 NADH:flavin oxidoreductase/NADH oxidase [Lysobacter capsici]